MQIAKDNTVEINLHNRDVATFRRIIELAICRLQSSPKQKMIGSPLDVQDGIKGQDLIDVKNMLTRLASEFDLGEPDMEPAKPSLDAEPATAQTASCAEQASEATNEDDDVPPEVKEILAALSGLPIESIRVVKMTTRTRKH